MLNPALPGQGGTSHAESDPPPSEYALKAAFLFNFSKFIDWPAASFTVEDSPLVICILGEDPFGNALDTLTGKTVNGRIITVRRCARMEETAGCHMIYFSKSLESSTVSLLTQLKNAPVLTVSDMNDFAGQGGMIALIRDGNRLQFEINLNAAETSHLKISSQLLKLAKKIH